MISLLQFFGNVTSIWSFPVCESHKVSLNQHCRGGGSFCHHDLVSMETNKRGTEFCQLEIVIVMSWLWCSAAWIWQPWWFNISLIPQGSPPFWRARIFLMRIASVILSISVAKFANYRVLQVNCHFLCCVNVSLCLAQVLTATKSTHRIRLIHYVKQSRSLLWPTHM